MEPHLRGVMREMVEVATESLAIRDEWESRGEDVAHPLREEVIKTLVDRRVADARGPVLVNIGGYHGQRTHVMGTPKRWLAEHLASSSSSSGGSFMSVYVAFARAEQLSGEGRVWFDLREAKRDGELLSRAAACARDEASFLPLDDPSFREPMPVNYMGHVVTHAPAATFDAYVVLPEGHLLAR